MTRSNLSALIDAYGELKAKIANLDAEERKLKKALADVPQGEYEGEKFRIALIDKVLESNDDELKAKTKAILDAAEEAFRSTLSTQYITAHTVKKPSRTHRVSARNGDVA
jgi:hypothetical protein